MQTDITREGQSEIREIDISREGEIRERERSERSERLIYLHERETRLNKQIGNRVELFMQTFAQSFYFLIGRGPD